MSTDTADHTSGSGVVYPDIERAATTILGQAHVYHPALRAWVKHLATDPDYQELLHAFVQGLPAPDDTPSGDYNVRADCQYGGWPLRNEWGEELSSLLVDNKAHPAGVDTGGRSRVFAAHMDEAIYRLAHRVARFRERGRPAGDQWEDIMGLGAPVAYIQTSLAAGIAAYVQDVGRAYADEIALERSQW